MAHHSGYLVPPDHLPTEEDGRRSHRLMGDAWAALHGGFRGRKYRGPEREAAIAKLRAMYAEEGMEPPSERHRVRRRL